MLTAFVVLSSQAREIVEAEHALSGVLGSAYDSHKEAFVGSQCVTGASVPSGASDASVSLDQSMTESQASDALGFSAGARARYGVVEASAAANFMSKSVSSDFSVSAIYSATYVFQKEKLPVPVKNETGKSLDNFERWNTTCGDYYVSEVRKGARLFFSIKIDFSSKEEKNEFQASFNIDGPAAGVSGTLQQASARFSRKTKITVAVYQSGGDVEKVTGIFSNAADGRAAYIQCSLGKFEGCATVLGNALTYATDTASGFPAQLGDPKKRSVLYYEITDYPSAGIYMQPAPFVEQVIQLKREELAKEFEKQFNLRKSADAVLAAGPLYIDPAAVQGSSNAINGNIHKILAVSTVCYEHPTDCPDAVDHMELDHVSKAFLYPPTFEELCKRAYNGSAGQELRPTIAALLLVFDSTPFDVNSNALPWGCDSDSGHMSIGGISDPIDLSKKYLQTHYQYSRDITSILPLVTGDLRTVNLSEQRITDIAPLALVPNLERVRIDSNQVADLYPLGMLKRLSNFYANDNQISDVTPLAALSNLAVLSVSGNLISDASVLAKAPRLRFLDISRNQISSLSGFNGAPELTTLNAHHNLIRTLNDFNPIRLESLEVEDNPIPIAEVTAFCKRFPHAQVSYTHTTGTRILMICANVQ